MLTTLTSTSESQTVIRYKTPKGIIYTQAQVDSIVNAKNERLKGTDMMAEIETLEKEVVADTIYYQYKLVVSNEASKKNELKKDKFLNSQLPNFQYKDLKGRVINSKDLKGKPIVLNFWFTTCLPCIAEMPELNRIKEKYKTSDIVFLSMTYETKDKVVKFLKNTKFHFQIIPDAKEYCDKFTESYPLNIFVDRNGIINNIQYGMPILYESKTVTEKSKVDPTEFEKALLLIK